MPVHKFSNALIHESSPYLLQHAHNPVEWHPWNDMTLAKARSLDKMLLISIGYSSCHWCHVMEKESFEDEAVATSMNKNYICKISLNPFLPLIETMLMLIQIVGDLVT